MISEIGSFSGKEADLVSVFQKITENYFLNLKCISEPIRSNSNQNSEARTDLSLIKENFMMLNFEAKLIETGIILFNYKIYIFFFCWLIFFFNLRKISKGNGNPLIQNLSYYVKYWLDHEKSKLINFCLCPTFLVQLINNHLQICGVIMEKVPIVEHLFDIQLQIAAGNNDHLTTLARVMASLKRSLEELFKWYTETRKTITSRSPGLSKNSRLFMISKSIENSNFGLTILKRLDEYKFVFEARVKNSREPKLKDNQSVILKLSKTYCEKAHMLLEKNEFAPKLYHIQTLPGGWKLIIMEYLVGFQEIKGPFKSEQKKKLEEIVDIIHKENIVHGDLREPNIMVSTNNEIDIRIIDFDWAGTVGQVFFPPNINLAIPWPLDAKPGDAITKKHDLGFIYK